MSKEAMKLALDALTFCTSDSMAVEELIDDAIRALEEALKYDMDTGRMIEVQMEEL
jgi:20S proteasome alpha/beta subunit